MDCLTAYFAEAFEVVKPRKRRTGGTPVATPRGNPPSPRLPPTRNRYGGRVGAAIRLRQGYGATRCCAQLGGHKNMCFCETNPPFFVHILDAMVTAQGSCGGMLRRISVGSFWKTNPPEGCFGGAKGENGPRLGKKTGCYGGKRRTTEILGQAQEEGRSSRCYVMAMGGLFFRWVSV